MTDSFIDNEEEPVKRRLQKALVVARNLKSQSEMEKEVNKELARRNEELRTKNKSLESIVSLTRNSMRDIENL